MKKHFITLILILCGLQLSAQESLWQPIEEHVKNNWDKYVEKNKSNPFPYTYALNPGTLYYWDFFFQNEGLLLQGRHDLALSNLNAMIYQVENHGFIPNAEGWGEDRSQTPVFSQGVRHYWESLPQEQRNLAWLDKAYRAVKREYEFWTNTNGCTIEDHTTDIPALNHYGMHSSREALVRFYDRTLKNRFYLDSNVSEDEKVRVAGHRMAEAETGQDFTPRFEGRCMDFAAVELNCFLYGMEMDLAYYEKTLKISNGKQWKKAAAARKKAINKYCWNEERGLYLDYDWVNDCQARIASVVTVMPLYFGIASKKQAARVVANLKLFDSEGGIVACEPSSDKIRYQWGSDAVWAPLQILTIDALKRYNYTDKACEVAKKWLNTITKNFYNPIPATHRPFKYGDGTRHPGFIYEKYNRKGEINDDEYPCSVMQGWTAASFIVALNLLRENGLSE